MKINQDIRDLAKQHGVHLWQIADCLGITDSALSKRLRYELSNEEKEEICQIIKNCVAKMGVKCSTEQHKTDIQDAYDCGYNCGYADAMNDIAKSEK